MVNSYHHQTSIVSRPSGPELINWNSNETFVGESNQNQNLSQNSNGQQIQQNYHNQTPIVSRPSEPEVINWNSNETFVAESNQNQNLSQNSNGQQTQQSYHNQRPIVSRPSGAEVINWNSNKNFVGESNQNQNLSQNSNGQQTHQSYHNQTSIVSRAGGPEVINWNSNETFVGKLNQNHSLTQNSTDGQQTHQSYYNRTPIVSRPSGPKVIKWNSSYVGGSNQNQKPLISSNHFSNRTSNTTKGKEVSEQTNEVVTPAILNRSSSTTAKSNEQDLHGSANDTTSSFRKITTTTTTTTTKAHTTANTTNSQRTYRSLRKHPKRVTFEENKQNCHDLTVKKNGIYKFGSLNEIANDGNRFFNERYCDFYTDNRAWTVIQRRFADDDDRGESCNRTWLDYKHGFGGLEDEFWFGNDFIHKLTLDDDMELRILLQDGDGNTNWMEYSLFKLTSEKDNYKLVIGGYSSSSAEADSLLYHNDQEFSTYDHRNGNNQDTSCASSIGNGWWFKNCSDKDILGNFLGSTSTKMMIRPKK